MKGMLVSIYRDSPATGNAYPNLVTDTADRALLVGETVPGIFDAGSYPVLVLSKRMGRWIATPDVPCPKDACGFMFGGNFIYCSDSRFPSEYPIPVHDRYEYQGNKETR